VPRNRADVARDTKVDEIVAAARRRLVDGGFPALSVAAVARELGVAQGAIYWYFPTRDDLFVAAVERIFHDILSAKPRRGTTVEHVLWFSDRLAEIQHLRLALHERATASEAARTFERDADALLLVMVEGALRGAVPAEELHDVASAVLALCEGALLRHGDRATRRRVIRFGYERLV
jgi:AcrR family transcriptional regulator